ncbi:MAG TPA: GAF domain-containing protein, partial [Rhodanobacteraceae bacterium]|nr:GAF domain-containing protein [Rhodanobacteraceae bacterium]
MAGNFHPVPTPSTAGRSSNAIALLQANGKLLAAADLDAVVGAARELLGALVPGVEIRRCTRGVGTRVTAGAFGQQLQISLSRRDFLLVTAPGDRTEAALLKAAANLIEARIEALGKQSVMAESVEHLGRSERLQRALYAIADQASSAGDDLTTMFQTLHSIVGSLMYAENFYIALYDATRDSVRFAYYSDVADPNIPNPHDEMSMTEILHGATWYVLHEGRPLMGAAESMRRSVAGPFRMVGAVCKDWLGVPLLHGTDVVGCVVVQSYDDAHHYSEQDKTLLIYVAQHIQTALERRLAHAELEHRVSARTAELQQQVLERQRGERLQAALFRIAELASTTDSIEDFYANVHRVVGDLLYARNFYIALRSGDGTELTFPYLVDERDGTNPPRKFANGLTEYVMRRGKALLADSAELSRLHAAGEVVQHGPDSEYWLGVPLVCSERTVGVLVVQSYSPDRRYTSRDQELLTFVSYHIANALERIRATESLRCAHAELEHRVNERTGALALANSDLRAE